MQRRIVPLSGLNNHRPTTWADVERALIFRLASGVYQPGDRLPNCADLAADLGVNKNTASKAYRALAGRGYLRTVRGRGTFVIRPPAGSDTVQSVDDVKSLLGLLLQEAKLSGLSQTQFLTLVQETTVQVYAPAHLRIAFVECNTYEAKTISRDLESAVSHPMQPLILQDIWADPEAVPSAFDVLVVSFAHLQELEECLGVRARPTQPEIIGILLSPDPDTLTEVARLPRGTRVGVVCDVAASAQKLTGLVAAYNAGIHVTSCVTSNQRALQQLLNSVDVVVAGFVAADHVRTARPQLPVIRVTWNRLEERSVRELAQRLDSLHRPRVTLSV
jgi:DNA-binding transcriptional regulator YhcF (GntR family)